MLTECAHELLRTLQQRVLEFDDVLELLVAKQLAAGIDRQPTAVFIPPATDGVIALEHKPQGVDLRVTAGAALVGGVLLQALADRQAFCLDLRVIRLDLRNHIRRGWRRIVEDHRGDPGATLDGTGTKRRRSHGKNRCAGDHSALAPACELPPVKSLRVGIEPVAIAPVTEGLLGPAVPGLQFIRAVGIVAVYQ